MQSVFDAVLPVFALILMGFLAAKRNLLGPEATTSLNTFVVWLALPALLFQAMATVKASDIAHMGFLAAFAIGMALTFVLSLVIDRRSTRRLADRSIEGLNAAYANAGFMGIPLGLAVFGPAVLSGLVLASLLTACGLFAFSIVLIEFDLNGGHSIGRILNTLLRSLARNPLVFSPFAGACFALAQIPLPGPVLHFTALLGAAASPCALVTIGLFLAQSEASRENMIVGRLVLLKLFVQPVITAIFAINVFTMPSVWAKTAILLSALPTGTGPFMLAKLYDREAAVTSRAILVSTVISVVTISFLVAFMQAG
jgi:hypothetical protein